MRRIKFFAVGLVVLFSSCILIGCGQKPVDIVVGSYADSTFTANTEESPYSLEISGTNLILKGKIPYSASVLGISAGNIVAIKFTPTSSYTPDDTTSIKTTNNSVASGWNEYGKEALEEDGSLIWVTSVTKEKDVQLKVKWNEESIESVYTLTVDEKAILEES